MSISLRKKLAAGVAATGLVAAAFTGIAGADSLTAGDSDEIAGDSDLPMGEVCRTNGTDGYNGGNRQQVFAWLKRQFVADGRGAQPDRVWAEDTNVAITATEGHSQIFTTVANPGFITTPSTWTDSQNHADLGPLATTVLIKDAPLGPLGGDGPTRKIGIGASGQSVAGTAHTDTNDVQVTATIVDSSTASTMDCVLPTASITNPVTPQPDYVQHSAQNAAYTCEDPESVGDDGISPSGSCVGIVTKPDNTTVAVANGSALPTGALGTYTLRVTPTDNVGNVGAVANRTYRVVAASADTYTVRFNQPIDGGSTFNKGKYGRVIPVKVTLLLNGGALTDGSGGPLTVGTAATSCAATAPTDLVEEYSPGASDQGLQFRFEDGQWIYNLDTTKLPGGGAGTCSKVFVLRNNAPIGSFLIQLVK